MQGSDLAVGGKLEGAMGQSTAQKVLGNKRKRGDSTMGLVESSSSSSMNFSASFSRRDSGESTRRIPYTSSIGSESKDGSLMEFLALAISTEMVSCPRRASILP